MPARRSDERSGELTPKQLRFVEEWLKDLNATQAYYRAGYAAKDDNSAAAGASTLLSNPKIKRVVSAAIREREVRSKVKQDRVLEEIAKIALLDPDDVFDFSNDGIPTLRPARHIPEHARRAIASFRFELRPNGQPYLKELKFHDKLAALEKLMRHLGAYELDNQQTQPPAPTGPSAIDRLPLELRRQVRDELRRQQEQANGQTTSAGRDQ